MVGRGDRISILADDLTGASDACAPLAGLCGLGHVQLTVSGDGAGRPVLSFDGNLRQLSNDQGRRAIAAFAAVVEQGRRAGGFVYLKIDSATRGHIARDVSLLLCEMPRFRGAVVAPAYPANGRLFCNGVAVFADRRASPASLLAAFEAAGQGIAVLSDYSGGPEAVGARIDAAFNRGCRIVLADTVAQADLERLAPLLFLRRGDVLSVGSAGLIEALAGGRSETVRLPRDQLTCLFGTRSSVSRGQLDTLEQQAGAIRCSRRPEEWRAIRDDPLSAAVDATLKTTLPRIFDICGQVEENLAEPPAKSFAEAVAPYLDRMGIVLMSGGDTARAVLERLGIDGFDVFGSFEHGIPICQAGGLPHPFLMKSGGFGDPETLLRLDNFIRQPENAA